MRDLGKRKKEVLKKESEGEGGEEVVQEIELMAMHNSNSNNNNSKVGLPDN